MKKILMAVMCMMVMVFGMLPTASAYTVGGEEAGVLDDFWAYQWNVDPNVDSEAAFINFYTGENFTGADLAKIEYENWQRSADGYPNILAIDFGTNEPVYFIIKSGDVDQETKGLQSITALYTNNSELKWGLVNLEALAIEIGFDTIVDIYKVSHATYPETPVPEPATMLLLGLGLIGLAGMRRKLKK